MVVVVAVVVVAEVEVEVFVVAVAAAVAASGSGPREEDFVFFWKTNQKYGWASQWFYSPFNARIRFKVLGEFGFESCQLGDPWLCCSCVND